MMKKYLILSLLLFVSCGYKPSSHYIKNIFTDKISVEVLVDKAEPENAPFVKDELNRLVYTRFKSRVVNKTEASNHISISYSGSTFSPIAYTDGYVTRYMANINVNFTMITKKGLLKKRVSTIVESDVQASSLLSASLRNEAIRKGLEKALDEFLAYVSAKGVLS